MKFYNMEGVDSRKLVIIGDGAIGKTCILEIFEKGVFPDGYAPRAGLQPPMVII